MSGIPYHAWTHRPKHLGGTDPIESSTDVPWCRLGLGGGTASPNTWTNADFSQAMLYNAAPGDVFTITDEGDRFTVDLEADGLYLVDFIVSWTDTFVQNCSIHAQGVTSVSNDWLYNEFYSLGVTKNEEPATAGFGGFHAIQHVCGMAWVSESVGSRTFDPQVRQASAASRGFDAYSLRFMYFGEIGAEASWEFQTT